ncbi:MAG: LacI family DNA-binding transcriptional regulator [Fibrobacteres bacterium]|nr:LacI family DNA-binding transcriptional regulator [Fibrobacterota bacterium]
MTQSLPNSSTLKTLAKSLDVSISTVSRALAGKKGVSEKQRALINDTARQMGISPNEHASSLRLGTRKGLAIIVSALAPEVARLRNTILISKVTETFGAATVIEHQPLDDINDIIRLALSKKCAAIILSGVTGNISPEITAVLKSQAVALTVIDGNIPGFDCIHFHRSMGTYQSVRLLVLSGKKNIHFLTGEKFEKPDDRLQGVIAACNSLNMPNTAINLVPVQFDTAEEAFKQTHALLASSAVDAIICVNDVMALGAMKAISEHKIQVPQQIAVIGFDNLPISPYYPIPLTTVSQPMDDAVDSAIELTRKRITDFHAEPVSITFPCNLIVRESAPILEHSIRESVFEKLPL